MTTEPTPVITLEKLCTNPNFIANNLPIKFGITDFVGETEKYRPKRGFYVQKDQTINAIALEDLPIYHEFHLQPTSANYIHCMQIHQNPKQPNQFNMLIGAMSWCCDGAILGGTYSLDDDSFDVKFATRVPFNTYAIVGELTFPDPEHNSILGHVFASGSGCHGAGIQYFTTNPSYNKQEFIYDLHKLNSNLDKNQRIAKHKPSDQCFLYGPGVIVENNTLMAGGLNIEEAFKISQEYYEHRDLLETEQLETEQKQDQKSPHTYALEDIEETLAKIRLAASQSSFITRNLHEVYP